MSVPSKHGIYAVSLGASVLGSITDQDIPLENDVQGEPTSGELYARIQALHAQKVAPGFTTRAIATALAACGGTGMSLATTNLILYAQQMLDGGGRSTGAAHRSYTFQHGILAPKTLTVNHREDATLSYGAVVGYDGTHDPIVIADSAALPSLTTTQAERYAMGPVSIGGVSFSGKTGLSIEFGLDAVGESADNDVWDTLVSIRQIQTVLTMTGLDVEWFKAANVPLTGTQAAHVDTAIYLQHRDPDGDYVADETATHIKLTACGLLMPENVFQNDGMVSLRMPLRFDGTNAPLVIDTTSAMP